MQWFSNFFFLSAREPLWGRAQCIQALLWLKGWMYPSHPQGAKVGGIQYCVLHSCSPSSFHSACRSTALLWVGLRAGPLWDPERKQLALSGSKASREGPFVTISILEVLPPPSYGLPWPRMPIPCLALVCCGNLLCCRQTLSGSPPPGPWNREEAGQVSTANPSVLLMLS